MLQKAQYAAEGKDGEDICGGKKRSTQRTWKWHRCCFRAIITCFCLTVGNLGCVCSQKKKKKEMEDRFVSSG